MIVPLNWVRSYIDINADTKELTQILTFSGIEVEGITELQALPPEVVTARVLIAEKVAGSDHLMLCQVDAGDAVYQVVCGAPNCHAGMTGILAKVGAQLPAFRIKKAKIKGVESEGMLCSEAELGMSNNHNGIIELPDATRIGASVNDILGLPDTVFEVEITPNRPDLLGILGIARDLSASLDTPFKVPRADLSKHRTTDQVSAVLSIINRVPDLCPRYTARVIRGLRVAESPQWLKERLIRAGLRPINNVVDITNFVMLETGHPLHAFDYDKLACPDGENKPQVLIRCAYDGEIVNALDDRQYSLCANDMVIADPEKAIALAGVIGLTNSHIEESTTSIVIESAGFNPQSVRRTTYLHKITTDSSYRFERGLAPESAEYASARAADLILTIAGGVLCDGVLDDWQAPKAPRFIGIRPCRYKQVIGYSLDSEQIKSYLCRLGLRFIQYATWIPGEITDLGQLYCFHAEQMAQGITEFTEKDDCIHTLYFEIPPARVDLFREIDLIEELARLDGYDKPQKQNIPALIMDMHAHQMQRKIADLLVGNGFYECINYSFADDNDLIRLMGKERMPDLVRLKNPPSANQAVMRASLISGLLRNLQYNLHHAAKDLALFELNKIYINDQNGQVCEPLRLTALATGCSSSMHWQRKATSYDIFRVKGILTSIFEAVGIDPVEEYSSQYPYLVSDRSIRYVHNGEYIAYCGMIRPEIAAAFGIDTVELKQDVWLIDVDLDSLIALSKDTHPIYQNIPRFPVVERDIALVLQSDVSYNEICNAIRDTNPALIKDLCVFDEYRGKQIANDARSLAIRLMICDQEKTLTDAAVENVIASVITMLDDKWQIKMR